MKNCIIFIISILFFYSCDKITTQMPLSDFISDDGYILPKISVEGIITSELKYQEINISKPQTYFTDSIYGFWDGSDSIYYEKYAVTGAEVSVFIDGVKYDFIESIFHSDYPEYKRHKGLYVSVNKIQGIPNKIHTLHIKYDNQIYEATDYMPAINPLQSFVEVLSHPMDKYSAGMENESMNFGSISFGKKDAYITEFSRQDTAYNYVNNEIDSSSYTLYYTINWNYFFSNNISPALMDEAKWSHRMAGYGMPSYWILTVKKLSISDAYQKYLLAVFNETEWNYSNFRTMPVNVPTNVTNGGLGFFAACGADVKKASFGELYILNQSME